jgi:hypothetical protein
MNVETSSLPSPLSQLLAHCDEASLHNGILSLRQLIPVHQSLIRCMDAASSTFDSSYQYTSLQLSLQGDETLTINLSLPLALNGDEERSICEENLSTYGGEEDEATKQDTKRLLVLQYLIQRMKVRCTTSYALKSLQFLLLPYLLQSSSTSSSEDFILAVLEVVDSMAVLVEPTSSPSSNELEAIVEQCLSSTASTTAPRTSCRILGRLVEKLVHQQNASPSNHEIQKILVKALYDRIGQVLDDALSWCSDTSTTQDQQHATLTVLLSCLSKDLLPLVVTTSNSESLSTSKIGSRSSHHNFLISLHRAHIDDLWRHLLCRFLKIIDHVTVGMDTENPACHLQTSNSDRLVLLVLTSIFCPLLPGLIDYRLPLIEKVPSADEQTATPFHQPLLWQVIFTSLSQGKSLVLEAAAGSTSSASPWTNNKSPIASSSNNTRGAAPTSGSWFSSATILRKRALYMLRTVAESSGSVSSSEEEETEDSPMRLWKTYVMCAETLNTESEQHLIDQIWGSVATLLRHVNASTNKANTVMERGGGGEVFLNWDWMGLLLSSILSNEQTVLRKLGLYRLLKGHMGLSIVPHSLDVLALDGSADASDGSSKKQQQQRKKKRTRNITVRGEQSDIRAKQNAALDMVDPEFVLYVLLPSWDSVGASMGYNMHLEENGKVVREDMVPLMTRFLKVYMQTLQNPSNKHDAETQTQRRRTFWHGLWSSTLLSGLRLKTTALIYSSFSEELEQMTKEGMGSIENVIPADEVLLHNMAETFEPLFQSGSVVLAYRTQFLQALAIMLKHCKCPADVAKKWSPMTILRLLALFTPEYFPLDDSEWNLMDDPMLQHLRVWIVDRMDTSARTVGATVASAFVGGYMLKSRVDWDPTFGPTRTEKALGWAIPLLCTLAVTDVQSNQTSATASELLWPAIHKAVSSGSNIKADQTTRALLLLENGCKLRQLSGLGNGDLVVDRKTQQPMPPPPNIEAMLSNVVTFMLSHVETLVASEIGMVSIGSEDKDIRSKRSMRISHTFARLIGQLRTLQSSFPSSMAVSSAVNEVLQSSVRAFSSEFEDLSGDQKVKHAALIYAAVSSGADPRGENDDDLDSYISLCQLLGRLEVREGEVDQTWEPTARAVLQYAKWGAISCLVPLLLDSVPRDSADSRRQKVQSFLHDLLVSAFDAVKDTSETALFPLFTCVLFAGKQWAGVAVDGSRMGEERSEQAYTENLQKMISALFKLMEGRHTSSNKTYMLNEFCSLTFNQKLLTDEYVRLNRNPKCQTPIRDAFRKLIEMAGPRRPHVTKSVLYRLTAGWLAIETDAAARHSPLGLVSLLLVETVSFSLMDLQTDSNPCHPFPPSERNSLPRRHRIPVVAQGNAFG